MRELAATGSLINCGPTMAQGCGYAVFSMRGDAQTQGNAVRKVLYLLIGLLLAIVLGSLYVKFSMPPGEVSAAATPLQPQADGPAFGLMVAVAIAC